MALIFLSQFGNTGVLCAGLVPWLSFFRCSRRAEIKDTGPLPLCAHLRRCPPLPAKARISVLGEWKGLCKNVLSHAIPDQMEASAEFVKNGGGKRAINRKVVAISEMLDREVTFATHTIYNEAIGQEVAYRDHFKTLNAPQRRKLEDCCFPFWGTRAVRAQRQASSGDGSTGDASTAS